MMWIIYALLAPILWSFSNIVDKFAIKNLTSHYIPFIFLLSIGNIVFAGGIALWCFPLHVSWSVVMLNLLSGLAIFMQYFTYSYALDDMDVSSVIPIHQSEPIFVLIITALMFHILPDVWQIVGMGLIIGGLLLLCISKAFLADLKNKWHTVALLLSAFFGAISTIVSDGLLDTHSVQTVLIFNFAGYALGGILLLLKSDWRRLIVMDIQRLNWRELGVFGLTNVFDVGGYVFFMLALAVATGPSAIVATIISIHPLFVLGLETAVKRLYPNAISETSIHSGLMRKLISTIVIVTGVVVVSLYE